MKDIIEIMFPLYIAGLAALVVLGGVLCLLGMPFYTYLGGLIFYVIGLPIISLVFFGVLSLFE
jgi:hypothetical protein